MSPESGPGLREVSLTLAGCARWAGDSGRLSARSVVESYASTLLTQNSQNSQDTKIDDLGLPNVLVRSLAIPMTCANSSDQG